MSIIDAQQRQRALDPKTSFIVQAPAGSGKTELLVRRFLILLANAKTAPEEIIAITFTRKAAAEMRNRILEALILAKQPPPQDNPYLLETWQLAYAALQRDQTGNWNLINNPNRLRVQTIDSFCSYLTQQMPLLSGFGAQPAPVNDADNYYLAAARALLQTLEDDEPWAELLAKLLLHLNNDHTQAENLFIAMLKKRDQWLPHLISKTNKKRLRTILENGLQHIIVETINQCSNAIPQNHLTELLFLVRYAITNLAAKTNDTSLSNYQTLTQLPAATIEQQTFWQTLAQLFLTADYNWRKKLDISNGFPADKNNKHIKERMLALINQLQQHENLRQYLQDILQLPPAIYNQQQWHMIEVLIELLPILAAQLTVVFRQYNVADFTEIAMAAVKALGEPESPTELALYLDHQIQHILVDEFQDTSSTQFRLLELLTSGWQPDDERTLFLVGDPMQSIYRFREAEVGLFLKAQQESIGDIHLEPITLQVNFRSTETIVDWINQHFSQAFPETPNITTGAVPFTPSVANTNASLATAVNFHALIANSAEQEAEKIIAIINQEQLHNPTGTIAILVRSRQHLLAIIPALKNAGLKFSAIEIEKLSQQIVISDLIALTKALLHPADRIAWLSILRAPWCGLTLTDLHALTANKHEQTIWQTLQHYKENDSLSADGKYRLTRFMSVLTASLSQRRRTKLRAWIEGTWLALGGPACLEREHELLSAKAFFQLLDKVERGGEINNLDILTNEVEKLYALTNNDTQSALQIMTIHKAKGLEFDTVIIPCLERKAPVNENQLLMWLDRPRTGGGNDLILAPIKSITNDDAIYNYLRQIDKYKTEYEATRLFYVAATRAKRALHLLGNVNISEKNSDQIILPDSSSFLALLWKSVEQQYENALRQWTAGNASNPIKKTKSNLLLRRLTNSWKSP